MKLRHTRQGKLISWIAIMMILFSSLGGILGISPVPATGQTAADNEAAFPAPDEPTKPPSDPPDAAQTGESTGSKEPAKTKSIQILSTDSSETEVFPSVYSATYQPAEPEPVILSAPRNIKALTEEINPPQEISLNRWLLAADGKINQYNQGSFTIDAYFTADQDITALEYTYSTDGAVWNAITEIINDDGLQNTSDGWHRQVVADLSNLADGSYYLRAAVTDLAGQTKTEECQFTKDTVPPAGVAKFTALPSADNTSMELTWTNPTEDFNCVRIDKFFSYDGEGDYYAAAESESNGYWYTLDYTSDSAFTDKEVRPYQEYQYRISTYDEQGNESIEAVTATGKMNAVPITLVAFETEDNGVVNAGNQDSYWIQASFGSDKDITSIEYQVSADGTTWSDPEITYDQGLYYTSWEKNWYRFIRFNAGSFAEGPLWLKATATDSEGKQQSAVETVSKDTIADNVTDLQVSSNAANDALVLSWTNPDDLEKVEVYRWVYYSGDSGSGYWDSLTYSYEGIGTYTDTDVYPYKNYTYKVVVYDKQWNEAANPPQVTGTLAVTGPITFQRFDVNNDGEINAGNVTGFYLTSYFRSAKDIQSIEYSYSADGTAWQSLDPYISSQGSLNHSSYEFNWYRTIGLNLSGPNGLADGTYFLRATAADVDGNQLSAERNLEKDATCPENVTGLTAVLNPEQTGFVLTWTNPASDFDHLLIERNGSYLSTNFTSTTYNDTEVTAGIPIRYRLTPVDQFGNTALNPTEITVVRPVGAPVLSSMNPYNEYTTRSETLSYSAQFIDDKVVNSMLFEVSLDGENWQPLNAAKTTPSLYADNTYSLSGTWDIKNIEEANYQIRVTAADVESRSTSVSRWVYIDRVPPAAPTGFTAQSTALGIKLSWSIDSSVKRYELYRYLNGSYNNNFYISDGSTSYTDRYAQTGKIYEYRLIPYDSIGNQGPAAVVSGELYTGPALTLEGGQEVAATDSAYTLHGTTEPGAVVMVNSNPVAVDESGNFAYAVTLGASPTTLTVAATSAAGTHTLSQTVTLDNLVPLVFTLNPDENTTLKGTSNQLYAAATDLSGSGIARIDFEVSTNDGQSWQVIGSLSSDKLNMSTYTYWDSTANKYHPSWSGNFYWDSTSGIGSSGPLADGAYKFRSVAYDKAGNCSDGTPVRIWKIDNNAPAAPTGLTATGAMEQVSLSWLPSPDTDLSSTPYRVYRSTDANSGFVSISAASSTSYIDKSVKGGTTYYYVVTARDKAGNESAYSTAVSCQPLPDTVLPVITSVTPSEGSETGGATVNVNVNATDNSANGIKTFEYEYSTDQGVTWQKMNGYSSGPYYYYSYYYGTKNWDTTGLNSGAYQLRITANDASGNTATLLRNIQLDVAVSPVQNLKAVPGEGAVVISWDANADGDCSGYEIYKSTYLTGGFSTLTTVSKDKLSYSDTAVTLGKTYYYQVFTKDSHGNQNTNSPVVFAKPGDDMTAPVITLINPAAGAVTGGPQISFSVQATDNKAVTVMDAVYSDDNGATWKQMQVSKTGPTKKGSSPNYYYQTDFKWTTDGLTSGSYKVKATAADAAGNAGSSEVSWTLDKTVTAAAAVSAVGGDASVKLDWQLIPDTDARGYLIARSSDPNGPFTVITRYYYYGWYDSWLPATQKTYTDTGLRPGANYYYRVISGDTYGNRMESATVSATTFADELPPTIISVNPDNGTIIGGKTAKDMYVYFRDNYGSEGATASIEYSTPITDWTPIATKINGPYQKYSSSDPYFYGSWDLSAMTSGAYTVRYVVYDGAKNKAIRTVNYQIDLTAPQAPGNLTATYGSGNISLVWEAPSSFDVSYYKVFRANALAGPYSVLTQVNGRASVTYTDNTVASGLTYYYKVTAVDNFGQEGEPSNIAAAAAISDAVAPTVLGISPDNGTVFGAQAAIKVVAEDNLALSRITLQYSTDQGVTWNDINTIASRNEAEFQWSTPPLNGSVQVRALARDSAGNFSDGNPVRTYTIDNQGPAQVTGLTATAYAANVVLQWQDVEDADFAYFQIERKDTPEGDFSVVTKVSSTLGCNVTNLRPNQDYWFRVAAYDTRGNRGTPSSELLVKTAVDTEAPFITRITPPPGYFGTELSLSVTAQDNSSVAAITIQCSKDREQWTDLAVINPENAPANATVNYKWDLSNAAEGPIYVRAFAVDSAGNSGQYSASYEYRVDRTGPAQPLGFTAVASSGYITVSWLKNSEEDIIGYNLYRSEAENGTYSLLAGQILNLSYRDRDILPGKTYYYKVAAKDFAGNEGALAGPSAAQLSADTENPVVNSIGPKDGSKLSGNPKIYVLASDNYRLAKVKLEYLAAGAAGDWTEIGAKEVNTYGDVLIFDWNNTELNDGSYQVRAVAFDQAGNQSQPLTVNYYLNVEPPQKPVVTAVPGGWEIDLSWSTANEADLAGFRVFRGSVMGGPYDLLKQTTATSYKDQNLLPNQRYYYMVQAVDRYGNCCDSAEINAVPTDEDHLAPTAEAGEDQTVTVGMEVSFDGTLSKDNDRIARYLWNFGDGTVSEAARPVHTYDKFGTYSVSLAVYDPAGNASAPDYVQVNVMPQQKAGSLEVRVLDDVSGAIISGASVVVQYPDGTLQKTYTNAQGIANLAVLPGDYKVYGYKTDYKPASADASVFVNQRTTATVRLKKGQLVVGELTVKRMTLDQIIDAGIDVNAPENQWVYKFEIHLAFNNTPLEPQQFIVNGVGEMLGAEGSGGGFSFSSGGEEMVAYPVVIPIKEHPEVRPTIAYMVVPGEARWLKEFFEVGLTLENTADPEFILAGSTATLTLPEGLALAPTREKQTLQVNLGEIAGGEKREVKWIIRGDKKGEYNLQAQFDGILQPFGDPVQTIFRTKEPFKVWGDDALQMHVQAQDGAWRGYPYHLRLGLENVSDVPVYNAAVELYDYGKQNYLYAPNQELVRSIRELPAGQTLWADYWLIPTIEGSLDLSQSYVVRTGGNANIETDMTSFAVPPQYQPAPEGQCPVLQQTNDDFSVDLSWDLVAGATGYRIYRVRDDLLISGVSDLVYETGPEQSRITLMEPYGAKDYILMTMFGDQEELRHAITGMSWENRAASPVITVDPGTVRVGSSAELLITVNSGGFPVADGTVDVGSFAQGVALDKNGQAAVTVTPSETGNFTVTAYDGSGKAIASANVGILPSLDEVPAIPTGLRVTGMGREAALAWNVNSEPDLAGYNVYWMVNNAWTRLNPATVTDAVYTVEGLSFGTPYVFAVTAVDQNGNESGFSVPEPLTLFRVPSTITTNLGSAAVVSQPVDFLVTTEANSDAAEPVRVRISLNNPLQAADLKLSYYESADDAFYPLVFDANGISWFGPSAGFPLADASSALRVTFFKTGVYGYKLETVACKNGSVLNGINKVIEVKGSYFAPAVRDNLTAQISAGVETAFQVTTKANSAQGAVVRLRVTLLNPAQRTQFMLKCKNSEGTYESLNFDAQGVAWLGTAEGCQLIDAVQELKVACTEPGSYRYRFELVELNSGEVLASTEKTVFVQDTYRPAAISDNLTAQAEPGKVCSFTVSTKANSEINTQVRIKLSLTDAAKADKVGLQYKGADGNFLPLSFNEQGVAWYGPQTGFPLTDKSAEFQIVFAEPGSYGYTLQVIDLITQEPLASLAKAVTVKTAAKPAAISDDLAQLVGLGAEQAFGVTTTANSDEGKLTHIKLSLLNPAQRAKVTLQAQAANGTYQTISLSEQGEAWLNNGTVSQLANQTINLKISFAEAGSYRYRLELIDSSDESVLAAEEKCVEVKSIFTAPTIEDTMPVKPAADQTYSFQVSTRANSAADKLVRVRATLADPAQAASLTLQYQADDGSYLPLVFDQQGVTWFGPAAGFPLQDRVSNFKIACSQAGSYRYQLDLVEVAGGQTLASLVKCMDVQGKYLPPVIESNLVTNSRTDVEQYFQVKTIANSEKDTIVRIRVTLTDSEQRSNLTLYYKDPTELYQQITFDSQGVAWFGPPSGFPLADAATDLKLTFSEPGDYDYTLQVIKYPGEEVVLAAAEQSVAVVSSSAGDRPTGSSGGSAGGTLTLTPAAAPVNPVKSLTDLPEDYWAGKEVDYLVSRQIITGYPDGTFQPTHELTRAELAAMVVKALKLETPATGTTGFTDVTSQHWAAQDIAAITSAGIMFGYGNGSFRPDAPITREEMVLVLYNGLRYGDSSFTNEVSAEALECFKDRTLIPEWAVGAVGYMVGNGLVQGINADLFGAGQYGTREEAAVLIYRVLEKRGSEV